MYCLFAILIMYFTFFCSLLYLSMSFFFLLPLHLVCALCFRLIALLISVVIQGLVCLGEVSLDGTCLLMIAWRAVLISSHICSTELKSLFRNESLSCWTSSFIPSESAFFHKKSFLHYGCALYAWMAVSYKTILWSLRPTADRGLHLILGLGWVVRIRSRTLSLQVWGSTLVEKSTCCSNPSSVVMIRKVPFLSRLYCFGWMQFCFQLISARLNWSHLRWWWWSFSWIGIVSPETLLWLPFCSLLCRVLVDDTIDRRQLCWVSLFLRVWWSRWWAWCFMIAWCWSAPSLTLEQ